MHFAVVNELEMIDREPHSRVQKTRRITELFR